MRNFLCWVGGLLLLNACTYDSGQRDTLTFTGTSFPAPITSLSPSNQEGRLFLGLDNGFVVIENRHDNTRSTLHAGNNRIYDVYEYIAGKDSFLLVGGRDEGLKLFRKAGGKYLPIQNYRLADNEAKNTFYGVYSIAFNVPEHTFYLGTSNGCYTLPADSLSISNSLTPFCLTADVHSAINKIISRNDTIYMAADSGFFLKVKNRAVEKLHGHYRAKNITLTADSLFILSTNNIRALPLKQLRKEPVVIMSGSRCYAYNIHEDSRWLLQETSLIYKKENLVLQCKLPVPIDPGLKQFSLISNDTLYLLNGINLLRFNLNPSHPSASFKIMALAEVAGTNDTVILLRDDFRLFQYIFDGQQRPPVPLQSKSSDFLFAIHSGLYKVNVKDKEMLAVFGENDLKDICYTTQKQLYLGTRHYLGLFDLSEKTVSRIPVQVTNGIDTSDLYVRKIIEDCKGDIYVLTLHKGLFKKEAGSEHFIKIASIETYGSAKEMVINQRSLYIYTSKGLYKYDMDIDVITPIPVNTPQLQSICAHELGSHVFALYYKGFSIINPQKDTSFLDKQIIEPDIPFQSYPLVVTADDRLLLTTASGAFTYEKGLVCPLVAEETQPANINYILLSILFTILFIVLIFILFQKYRHDKKQAIIKGAVKAAVDADIEMLRTAYKSSDSEKIKTACDVFISKYLKDYRTVYPTVSPGETKLYVIVLLLVESVPQSIAAIKFISDKNTDNIRVGTYKSHFISKVKPPKNKNKSRRYTYLLSLYLTKNQGV